MLKNNYIRCQPIRPTINQPSKKPIRMEHTSNQNKIENKPIFKSNKNLDVVV